MMHLFLGQLCATQDPFNYVIGMSSIEDRYMDRAISFLSECLIGDLEKRRSKIGYLKILNIYYIFVNNYIDPKGFEL